MLNEDASFRAIAGRDRRFEGQLFVGVTSTGIYCRPGCPARTPKRSNMRFFACSAAAENEGFRACRRCRPDSVPGSPAWVGTSATVTRALRLIAEGAAGKTSVEDLAERLGVTSRHLRRLFSDHLGASPSDLSRTRRAHFACQLIERTALRFSDVAHASGFESVRQFNDVVRQSFGAPPRQLRRSAGEAPVREGEFDLSLPVRLPFDWPGLVGFLGARTIPGVEEVIDSVYRRTFEIGGRRGVVRVGLAERGLALRVGVAASDPSVLLAVSERVTALFDLGADPAVIGAHLSTDRKLSSLVTKNPGRRVPGAWTPFEIAVRAILGQQVSVAAARTLAGRLADKFGERLKSAADGPAILFPRPESLAVANLEGIGLTRARAATLRRLADATAAGRLSFAAAAGVDEVVARLRKIPGIGPWTAQYIAMRGFHEPDAFPAGDLGIRRALERSGKMPTEREVENLAERWRPWRAYAAMHLWTKGAGG